MPLRCEPAAFLESMRSSLAYVEKGQQGMVNGVVVPPNIDLHIRADSRHFFSPMLSLKVVDDDEGDQVLLLGRFAPRSDIWMLYMAVYGVLGLVGTAGLMYGTAQWLLGQPPWALIILPLALLGIGLVYGAAFIGQGLGAQQMYALRSFLDHVLEAIGHPPSTIETRQRRTKR